LEINRGIGMERTILIYDAVPVMKYAYEGLFKDISHCKLFFASTELEMEQLLKAQSFDLVIVDVFVKQKINYSLVKRISRLKKSLNIAVFSAIYEEETKRKLFALGASVVLEKTDSLEYLTKTLVLLTEGSQYFDAKMKIGNAKLKSSRRTVNPLLKLSSRELQVAELLILGLSNQAMTQRLDLAATTVSTYKKRIFAKIGVTNILELAAVFKKHQ
jgi:DNA-binding NarL/FixJ family response regulator